MPKARERGQHSVFLSYLFSYGILAVLFTLLVYGASYALFTAQYERDILSNHTLRCENMAKAFDTEITRLAEIAVRINDNPLLSPSQLQSSYSYYLAVRELAKYQVASKYVEDIVLIYDPARVPYAFTCRYTHAYTLLPDIYGLTAAQLLPDNSAEARLLSTTLAAQQVTGRRLLYLYPMRLAVNPRIGLVLYQLNPETVTQDLLAALDVGKGAVFLVDDSGQVVYAAARGMDLASVDLARLIAAWGANGRARHADGRAYVRIPSEHGGAFLTVLEGDQVTQSLRKLQQLMSWMFMLVLSLGMAAAWFFARRAYRPIRHLADTVHSARGQHDAMRKNELHYIEEAFAISHREKQLLLDNIHAQSRTVIGNVLLSLLRGNDHIVENGYLLESLGMTLNMPDFRLVLTWIDRYADFSEAHSAAERNELREKIMVVLQHHAAPHAQAYSVESTDGTHILTLLNHSADMDDAAVRAYGNEVQRDARECLGLSVSVVYGAPFAPIGRTAQQRKRLIEASKHRVVAGHGTLIHAEQVPDEPPALNSPYAEYDLYLLYKRGEWPEVQRALEELFDTRNRVFTASLVFMEYYKVLGVMHKVNAESHSPERLSDALRQALSTEPETIDSLMVLLHSLSRALLEIVSSDKESKNESLKRNVMLYIHENYTRPELNQEEIADVFQITASYLSRYFKNQTGQSLSSYLDGLRMREACRLLLETQLPVKDIVQRVGYGTPNHFIRKFRGLYHMTPTAYRRLGGSAPKEESRGEKNT